MKTRNGHDNGSTSEGSDFTAKVEAILKSHNAEFLANVRKVFQESVNEQVTDMIKEQMGGIIQEEFEKRFPKPQGGFKIDTCKYVNPTLCEIGGLWVGCKGKKPENGNFELVDEITCIMYKSWIRWITLTVEELIVILTFRLKGLRNVELFFLPPNTTSKIQPCGAGINRAFKMHYRRRFYKSLLEGYELGVPNPAKINVLDAMNLAISAWTMDVHANTIVNCFRRCKLRSTDNMTFENSDEGGESTQELQNLIKELGYRNAMDVEDVLTHLEENVVAQLLTDEEIIESVIGNNKDDIDEEDDKILQWSPLRETKLLKRQSH
ncbi:CENP-B homolog protein 2-like [Rutidosis leptorrhynchoides]|uniref:CENP-B homolog protein 2-like n=1 Tax=Rutidosis leptorrhynchoides TaxID=125765 RepID=UPI003A996B89